MVKARALVERRPYTLIDAVPLIKKAKYAKFDETVDLNIRLGVDPKHADQMVRGTVVLPHGLGKTKIVAVITSGDKIADALAAGAEFAGGDELVEKIQKENWTAFDALIATPDMMKSGWAAGQGAGAEGPDAQPQDRHGDDGCGGRDQGDQGRQGGVPHGQDRAGACSGRQAVVRAEEAGR